MCNKLHTVLRDRAVLWGQKRSYALMVFTVFVYAVVFFTSFPNQGDGNVQREGSWRFIGSRIESVNSIRKVATKFGDVCGGIWKYVSVNEPTPSKYLEIDPSGDIVPRLLHKRIGKQFYTAILFCSRSNRKGWMVHIRSYKDFLGWFDRQMVNEKICDRWDGGGCPSIFPNRGKLPNYFRFSEGDWTGRSLMLNYIGNYKGTLDGSQGFLRSIGSFFRGVSGISVGAIHEDGKKSVDTKNDKTSKFQGEFGVSKFSFKTFFKIIETFFCLIFALIFAAVGLVHIHSLENEMSNSEVAKLWIAGFGSLFLGSMFVFLMCWRIITL